MKVKWTSGVRTILSDQRFIKEIKEAIEKMPEQYLQSAWIQAYYAVYNQTGFNRLPAHSNGVYGSNIVNGTLTTWWTEYSDVHGYGIFHGIDWTTGPPRLVGLCNLYPLNTDYNAFLLGHPIRSPRVCNHIPDSSVCNKQARVV